MIDAKDIEVGQIVEVYYFDLDVTLDAKVVEIDEDEILVDFINGDEVIFKYVILNPNYEVRLKK